MRCGIDKATSKGSRQQVAKSIALLKHAGDETSGTFRAIFESGRCCVTVEATHRDAVNGSHA